MQSFTAYVATCLASTDKNLLEVCYDLISREMSLLNHPCKILLDQLPYFSDLLISCQHSQQQFNPPNLIHFP